MVRLFGSRYFRATAWTSAGVTAATSFWYRSRKSNPSPYCSAASNWPATPLSVVNRNGRLPRRYFLASSTSWAVGGSSRIRFTSLRNPSRTSRYDFGNVPTYPWNTPCWFPAVLVIAAFTVYASPWRSRRVAESRSVNPGPVPSTLSITSNL